MGLTEFQDIFKGYCDVEKIEKKNNRFETATKNELKIIHVIKTNTMDIFLLKIGLS